MILAPRQAETAELIRGDAGEDIVLLTPILEIRNRCRALNHIRFVLPDFDESLRLLERERAQQHGVHNAEDRAVCADAERERKHSDERKSRLLQQHSRAIAQVLPQYSHDISFNISSFASIDVGRTVS